MNNAERKRLFHEEAVPLLDSLYNTALRMTGNAATAEDLTQDTMLKTYSNLHRFERGTNFRAWAFRILTNNFINEYRRKGRRPASMDFSEVDPMDPFHEPTFFTAEDLDQFKEHLGDPAAHAIDNIPEDFRLIFLLSTLEDFSYKEISSITGLPIGTVMSRLFRARKFLREELAQYARNEGFRT